MVSQKVRNSTYEVMILPYPRDLKTFLSNVSQVSFEEVFNGRKLKLTLNEVCYRHQVYGKYDRLTVAGSVDSKEFKDSLDYLWRQLYSHSCEDYRCKFRFLNIDAKHKLKNGVYWQELGTLGYSNSHPLAPVVCTDVLVLIRKSSKAVLSRQNRLCY